MQKLFDLALATAALLLIEAGPSLARNQQAGRACPMDEENLIDDALFLSNSSECMCDPFHVCRQQMLRHHFADGQKNCLSYGQGRARYLSNLFFTQFAS